MLTIEVDGNALHISKGTSLQMELNSSVFSTEGVEGDIMFTFDVPAQSNDMVFRHARFAYVQRMRKYACTVFAGGIEIARGDLYIQKATQATYSCGLVINPWPTDYADRKLCENDYGEDITISSNPGQHNAQWSDFLKSTLNPDSLVKFPLFLDTAFYGGGNNDFGWFLLQTDSAPSNASGYQASLQTNNSVGLDRCYLNRLFFDGDGNVIDAIAGNRGIRLFNDRRLNNPNSFAFCPALRLTWLLEKVIGNGGYRATGGFFGDNDTAKVFSQSLRALDGLITQYSEGEAGVYAEISPTVICSNEPVNISKIVHFIDSDGNTQLTFSPTVGGAHHFHVVLKTYLPANLLQSGTMEVTEYGHTFTANYVEGLFFMLSDCNNGLPTCMTNDLNGDWSSMSPMSTYWAPPVYFKMFKQNNLSSFGYVGAGFYELTFDFTANGMTAGRSYRFIFAKCRGHNVYGQGTGGQVIVNGFENVPVTDDVSAYYKVFNCFANRLRFAEHVPDMTNAAFISTLCETFGLALFLDSATKRAEFAFIRDIIEKAKCLDLTVYAVDKDTALEKNDERKFIYTLEGISTDDIDTTKLLPPVRTASDLPDAMANYGKSCFVENENQYRKAEREGNAISNWVFRWNPQSGANQSLEVGNGNEENVTPSLKIPVMKVTDTRTSSTEFILQIEQAGCSPLFETGNTGFGMVLETYMGNRKLNNPQVNDIYFEVAQPTCYNRDGQDVGGVSLTVDGENSVGQRWVKPWLSLLAKYEKVKYRFQLPLAMFISLWRLLKPQDESAESQTRWLMVGNVKSLPVKITFQFTEGGDTVIADVEAAKLKVEI
ncbi:MAG: hypothetical protein II865_10470 [Bacteroidales bacterium]|nr:hypothetical protein [Bacteroidales bacterium]